MASESLDLPVATSQVRTIWSESLTVYEGKGKIKKWYSLAR